MSRTGITYEDVAAAADELAARQVNVTIERVRQALGTGSHLTISRHLSRWRAERQGTEKPQGSILPDLISRAVESVWREIRQAAQAEIDQAKAQADTAISAAFAREQAASEVQRLASEQVEKRQIELTELNATVSRLQQDLVMERAQRAAAERESHSAEEHLAQMKEIVSAVEQKLRESERQAQAGLREERQRASVLRSRLENQIEQLKTKVEEASSNAHAASLGWVAKEARYLERLDSSTQQLVAAKAEVTRLREQVISLSADKRDLEATIRELNVQAVETERGRLAAEKRYAEETQMREQRLQVLISEKATLEEQLRTITTHRPKTVRKELTG